jgi:spermidine/putrescine transport system permease protein
VEPVQGVTPGSGRRLWTGVITPGALILLALFLLPLLLLVVFSFGTVDIIGRPVFGFTGYNYSQVFQSYNLPVLWRTIGYAALATAVCLVLGYAVAYTAARFAGRWGPVLVALVVVPWLVDYLVRIYAWEQLLGDAGIINGLLGHVGVGPLQLTGTWYAVVGGLVYGYLPLMVLPIYASLGDLDPALIDAGKDLYGTPRQTFWHVTLPATRNGVIGGCLLVFLPILGDFATAQFLGGANSTMIGNIVAQQFVSTGSQTFGAALTVMIILLLIVATTIAWLLIRRRGRGRLRDVVTA